MKKCPTCLKSFNPPRASSKFCSRPCLWATNGGKNKKTESWWKNARGYIEGRIWLQDGTQIRIKHHRFVMQGVLGRPLKPGEDVHHIDGVKTNNHPSNLMVVSHSDHSKKTNSIRVYKKGYKLKLSKKERRARSFRAIAIQLDALGRAAIAKAEGEEI